MNPGRSECLSTTDSVCERHGVIRAKRLLRCGLLLAVLVWLPGCASVCARFPHVPLCPPPCRLPPNASVEEIVAYLNRNVMQSWRSSDVSIRVRGTPVPLSANIAVESPRNFRLMGGALVGSVDVGSNSERFWLWTSMNEPKQMLTATHEELARGGHTMPIPFQPEWLMEALSVVPIDSSDLSMAPTPSNPKVVRMTAHRVSPQGEPVLKEIVVDVCYGRILEQAVYDASRQLVAKAVFRDHRVDANTGIEVAHSIVLEWPRARMSLTMRIGHIEVDPPPMPAETWTLPNYDAATLKGPLSAQNRS